MVLKMKIDGNVIYNCEICKMDNENLKSAQRCEIHCKKQDCPSNESNFCGSSNNNSKIMKFTINNKIQKGGKYA